MTQQLDFDFSQQPVRNPEYFFPLSLKLDPEEKANFIATGLVPHRNKITGTQHGLSNVGNADQYFPRTIAQTNEFVKPLGLEVRRVTLFLSDKSQTSWVVHSDGVWYNKKPAILEARLSYYEIADAPGAIRWWDDNLKSTLQVIPATDRTQERVSSIADCAEDLRTDRITWADIPQPAFSAVTSSPSALLRTNRLHHVIQGPGLRVTVACQLVFPDGNPVGVWEHIEKNIHLLGI
jgi:hypothetical protein